MTFATPWALALLVLPAVSLLIAWRRRRTRAGIAYPSGRLLAGVPRTLRARLGWTLPVLRALAIAALVVALARPQKGFGRVETATDAVAMQLVVDRSGSMRAPMTFGNQQLDRLTVVKRVLHDFVLGDGIGLAGREGDLLGLITFARYAETVCPLVRDHETLVALADATRMATPNSYEDGTAIGDAIALAAARLQRVEEQLAERRDTEAADELSIKSKVIVLLTDGQDNASDMPPLDAAELASEWGIKIYTIGIGDRRGGFFSMGATGVDEAMLRAIAERTGGVYRLASDAEGLREVYEEIEALEKTTVRSIEYTDYEERFVPFALAGACLLALEQLLALTLLRRTV